MLLRLIVMLILVRIIGRINKNIDIQHTLQTLITDN